jgi:hypothetical protein
MLMPRIGNAQDAQVTKSMAALKDRTAKLGAPKIEGKAAVGGKEVPALFFGSTKMNNNVAVVDEVTKAGGKGVAATLFVKDGDQFVRSSDNGREAGQNRTGDWDRFGPWPRSRCAEIRKSVQWRGLGLRQTLRD